MNELQIRSIVAGVMFGMWPLFMNLSGLKGSVSAACYGTMALVCILPIAYYENGWQIPPANWRFVLIAGLVGAVGLLCFNGMLAQASRNEVGKLFVLMIVVQTTVPAIYHTISNGQLRIDTLIGYLAAALAAFLLTR